MPYIDFINREDVYGIISTTLNEYFRSEVYYTRNNASNEGQGFFCFSRINAIIPVDFSKDVIEFIKRDNNITNSLIKRVIIRTYIFLVLKFPYNFSEKLLIVKKPDINLKNIMIYPGNKKIKVIDFNSMTVVNILKTGFERTWFNKEIHFRINSRWNFVLPLECLDDNTYRERFISGFAYVRLSNNEKAKHFDEMWSIIQEIQKLSKITKIEDYLGLLKSEFESKLQSISNRIDEQEIESLESFFAKIIGSFIDSSSDIKLCFSHGDLQEGNIFLEKNNSKIWVLDWETWNERSDYYDKLLFYYGFRNSHRLAKNIRAFLKEDGKMIRLKATENRYDIVKLFLLEDILWQIDETSILNNKSISNGLIKYSLCSFQESILSCLSK